jgi:hypothetical protein
LGSYGTPPALEVRVEDTVACGGGGREVCTGAGYTQGAVLGHDYTRGGDTSCDYNECEETCSCFGPAEHRLDEWFRADDVLTMTWGTGQSHHSYCVSDDARSM